MQASASTERPNRRCPRTGQARAQQRQQHAAAASRSMPCSYCIYSHSSSRTAWCSKTSAACTAAARRTQAPVHRLLHLVQQLAQAVGILSGEPLQQLEVDGVRHPRLRRRVGGWSTSFEVGAGAGGASGGRRRGRPGQENIELAQKSPSPVPHLVHELGPVIAHRLRPRLYRWVLPPLVPLKPKAVLRCAARGRRGGRYCVSARLGQRRRALDHAGGVTAQPAMNPAGGYRPAAWVAPSRHRRSSTQARPQQQRTPPTCVAWDSSRGSTHPTAAHLALSPAGSASLSCVCQPWRCAFCSALPRPRQQCSVKTHSTTHWMERWATAPATAYSRAACREHSTASSRAASSSSFSAWRGRGARRGGGGEACGAASGKAATRRQRQRRCVDSAAARPPHTARLLHAAQMSLAEAAAAAMKRKPAAGARAPHLLHRQRHAHLGQGNAERRVGQRGVQRLRLLLRLGPLLALLELAQQGRAWRRGAAGGDGGERRRRRRQRRGSLQAVACLLPFAYGSAALRGRGGRRPAAPGRPRAFGAEAGGRLQARPPPQLSRAHLVEELLRALVLLRHSRRRLCPRGARQRPGQQRPLAALG